MKLVFEQTGDDLIDLSKDSLVKNRSVKIYAIVLGVVLLLYGYGEISKEDFQLEILLIWAITIGVIGVIWVFLFKYFLKKRFQEPGNSHMMIGRREIELTEDVIKVWTPVAETVYQWAAVTKMTESATNYFLYLGKAQAIIVSKSAFQDADEQAAFEQLVATKVS